MLGAGDVVVIHNFLSEQDAAESFVTIQKDTNWFEIAEQQLCGTYSHRVSIQSDVDAADGTIPIYHCADPLTCPRGDRYMYEGCSWSPPMQAIKDKISEIAGHSFNWCHMIYGYDFTHINGFHSDKCTDVQCDSWSASLYLGADRDYVLKPRLSAADKKRLEAGEISDHTWDNKYACTGQQFISLKNNTLLLLGPETTANFFHSVVAPASPSCAEGCQAYISLTFRDIWTFYVPYLCTNRGDDCFYGRRVVGSPSKTDLVRTSQLRYMKRCITLTAYPLFGYFSSLIWSKILGSNRGVDISIIGSVLFGWIGISRHMQSDLQEKAHQSVAPPFGVFPQTYADGAKLIAQDEVVDKVQTTETPAKHVYYSTSGVGRQRLQLTQGSPHTAVVDVDVCIFIDPLNDFLNENGRFCITYGSEDTASIRKLKSILSEVLSACDRSRAVQVVLVTSDYAPSQFDNISNLCTTEWGTDFALQDVTAIMSRNKYRMFVLRKTSNSIMDCSSDAREQLLNTIANKNVMVCGVTSTHCVHSAVENILPYCNHVVVARDTFACRDASIDQNDRQLGKRQQRC